MRKLTVVLFVSLACACAGDEGPGEQSQETAPAELTQQQKTETIKQDVLPPSQLGIDRRTLRPKEAGQQSR